MAILSREIIKEIESHFYGYQIDRRWVEERKQEIAESIDYSQQLAKAANSSPADTTYIHAVEIDKNVGQLQKWIRVVDETIKKFKDTPHMQLMTMLYTERQGEVKICDALYIDRSTLYRWKDQILTYAAMKACGAGLIEV